jgi:hypothetical protein
MAEREEDLPDEFKRFAEICLLPYALGEDAMGTVYTVMRSVYRAGVVEGMGQGLSASNQSRMQVQSGIARRLGEVLASGKSKQ